MLIKPLKKKKRSQITREHHRSVERNLRSDGGFRSFHDSLLFLSTHPPTPRSVSLCQPCLAIAASRSLYHSHFSLCPSIVPVPGSDLWRVITRRDSFYRVALLAGPVRIKRWIFWPMHNSRPRYVILNEFNWLSRAFHGECLFSPKFYGKRCDEERRMRGERGEKWEKFVLVNRGNIIMDIIIIKFRNVSVETNWACLIEDYTRWKRV